MNKIEDAARREEHPAGIGQEDWSRILLALKSTVLETLFVEAGVLTGRSFSTYADLHSSIIRFFDD